MMHVRAELGLDAEIVSIIEALVLTRELSSGEFPKWRW
jgi:hypothetical protein